MSMRLKEFHRPASRSEALALLRRTEVRTLPLISQPRPEALQNLEAEAVVDLSHLNLAYLETTDATLRLGAQLTLQRLADAPELERLGQGLVPAAARLAAHWGLRHLATLAGALLSPEQAPELSLAWLALGAQAVVTAGEALQAVPLADYVAGGRPADELLIEVNVAWPPQAGAGGALERVARTPRDTAIMAAAAYMEVSEGQCRAARLALWPAGTPAGRLAKAAGALLGKPVTPAGLQAVAEAVEAEVNPPTDFRAGAEYRRAMAGVLARRALAAAGKRALGAGSA